MKNKGSITLHSFLLKITVLPLLLVFGYACSPKDLTLSTFTGQMIYSYLNNPKDTTYSEFVKIIDKAGLKGMLCAYGDYTCLPPTNKALRVYYKTLGNRFTLDSLTSGQIDTLAKTHIIPNRYLTIDLGNGVIPNTNMNNRYIEINFDSVTAEISLNHSSHIVLKDVEVYNGVIQGIDRVLKPLNVQLPDMMEQDSTISIFTKALFLTRLSDSLRLISDKNYSPTKVLLDPGSTRQVINPKEKRYGYTAFVESNTILKVNGINNLVDLIDRAKTLYPGCEAYDGDYTNRNNSLNKYIAYHLINKAIYSNKFFYTRNAVQDFTPDEFIETMLPNRIIRASKINSGIVLNNNSDHISNIIEGKSKATVNGIYHELNKLLVYTQDNAGSVENMLQNIRIRFDINSLFPEMTNNNIRGSEGVMKQNNSNGDYYGFEPGYLSGIKFNKDTRLIYLAGKDGLWQNFQADELMGLGTYDITIRFLPVPPGTYEIRFGYSANSLRSITQMYVDNKPVGIPLDLTTGSSDPRIGYIIDTSTDDDGFENDKTMRNRGYMKAPNTIRYGSKTLLRDISTSMRRIVGTFIFDKYEAHTLRFRSVTPETNKQCMMDYLELVPKAVYNRPDGEPEGRD